MSEITEKILAIIENKGFGKVKVEEKFLEIGVDSLDMVELIMDIEKEFNIVIPDEEAFNLVTVADAIALVEKKTK